MNLGTDKKAIERKLFILNKLAKGCRLNEIAAELGYPVKMVEQCLLIMKKKNNARTTTQLVVMAIFENVIQ